jgi:hypothetical protein
MLLPKLLPKNIRLPAPFNIANILSEFDTQNDIVMLQDSLQRLAAMPEKQRMEVIQKIIRQVEKEEKEAAEKSKEEKLH